MIKTIRIRGASHRPPTLIEVDGLDISHWVTGAIVVQGKVDDIWRVHLTLLAEEIDVELMAKITAIPKKGEKK